MTMPSDASRAVRSEQDADAAPEQHDTERLNTERPDTERPDTEPQAHVDEDNVPHPGDAHGS